MGTAKLLSLIVIFSIAVMLSFSMLPVMATPGAGGLTVGVCPGGPNGNSPWIMIHTHPPGLGADVNGNGHVCLHEKSSIEKDDRIPNKL